MPGGMGAGGYIGVGIQIGLGTYNNRRRSTYEAGPQHARQRPEMLNKVLLTGSHADDDNHDHNNNNNHNAGNRIYIYIYT